MTSVILPKNDPRGPKAVALATDAGQWIKCTDKLGRKAYGVPSSEPGRYYLVTRESCTCPAFEFGRGRDCKHIVAVRLHCEYVREQQQAAKYDDIFARFEQDDRPVATPELSRILGKPRRYTSGPYKGLPVTERED